MQADLKNSEGAGDTDNPPNEQAPQPVNPKPAAQRAGWFSWVLWILAGASLILPSLRAGLWDPFELRWASISRRIAVNVLGAEHLTIDGADNAIPTVEELGRGELPFHLVALGFKLGGLVDWAGRLPLTLAALAGALAFYAACRRLAGGKLALFSSIALLTTPLFFTHARTILGDAVTMACVATAFSTLALACFDDRLSRVNRSLLYAAGLACLAAGFLCRGLLIGVAVPALAVGLTWLCLGRYQRSLSSGFSGLTVVIGVLALGLGCHALFSATPSDYWMRLGAEIKPPKQFPTHDFIILHLGHALFPWSAFIPVAIGLSLRRPGSCAATAEEHAAQDRESALRLALLLCSAVAVGVHTLIAPRTGPLPFSAVFAMAGLVGFGLLEWDRRPHVSPTIAITVAAFLILLVSDFRHFPDKTFSPFALPNASFPESFGPTVKRSFIMLSVPAVLGLALLAIERLPLIPKLLNLSFVQGLWRRVVQHLGALAWLCAGFKRGVIAGTALGLCGLGLSLVYYPAQAAQVSPIGAFHAYLRLRTAEEPLATLGKGGSASVFYGSREQRHFESDSAALAWLIESSAERRWLIVKTADLPRINSQYRNRAAGKNLPVLDATSGEMVLVSNLLRAEEKSQNPFDRFVSNVKPEPTHIATGTFGNSLKVVGWEIRNEQGAVTGELTRGNTYTIHLYYEVLGRVTKDWKTFVHIDGPSTRVNADHDTLEGKYPLRYLNKGDFITDVHEFDLEPDITPGRYTVHFGFYSGKTRWDITQGEHKDDRVAGGSIQVK